jgi:hypothetical protein
MNHNLGLLAELEGQAQRTARKEPVKAPEPHKSDTVTWEELEPEFKKRGRAVTWKKSKAIFQELGLEIKRGTR